MSAYLCFRKNGVYLCNFCRVAPIVDLFNVPNSDTWEKIPPRAFDSAIEEGTMRLEVAKQDLENLKLGLTAHLNSEMLHELLHEIQDEQDEIATLEHSLTEIRLLKQILMEESDMDDEGNEIETNAEWLYDC